METGLSVRYKIGMLRKIAVIDSNSSKGYGHKIRMSGTITVDKAGEKESYRDALKTLRADAAKKGALIANVKKSKREDYPYMIYRVEADYIKINLTYNK